MKRLREKHGTPAECRVWEGPDLRLADSLPGLIWHVPAPLSLPSVRALKAAPLWVKACSLAECV